MKTRLIVVIGILFSYCINIVAQKEYVTTSTHLSNHPRILLQKGEEKKLKKTIMKDAVWKELHLALLDEAKNIVGLPTSERVMTGKRLLYVSRENLRRIFVLSYAYRMTGNVDFFKQAEAEMLKAASFSDWNPSHFLDVGEMTMALAIGYDWLYPQLSKESRMVIKNAIVEKGFKPSFDNAYNKFLTVVHNWNQVCNAGLTYGALAIWEDEPELSSLIVNRAIETIKLPMEHYAPDGAYPEGVGYWDYGTTFNALFLSALEKAFGSDFGLSQSPGFMKTGEFVLHMVTPNLKNFAFSDNSKNAAISSGMFWFYDKTKDASILYNQAKLYNQLGNKQFLQDRLAPVILIWGASASLSEPQIPTQLQWKAQGDNPICMMRSAWGDTTSLFVGVKLGSPSVNHGHMDVGSFVLESDGILWAMDLGAENYNKLETLGVDLWNRNLGSQRWDVYRLNNFVHNTLTFNRKYQYVEGKAQIDRSSDKENHMYVVSDLTPVYKDQVKRVERAVSLVDKKYVVVEDCIETNAYFTMLSWSMATAATVKILSDNTLVLEKEGKKLYMKVEAPENIRWKISPAESEFTFDSPNPGITIVRFDTDLKVSAKQKIKVYLMPGEIQKVGYDTLF